MKSAKNKNNRYLAIDGMRGIAALGVVFYHLSGNLQPELSQLLPEFINISFSYGFLGVPIFFVISGFVISLSMGNSLITPKYAGLFIFRRSLRLDPTYWASIGIAIILISIKNQYLGTSEEIPSFSNVFVHIFYLQDILSSKPVISSVYWTLCLEVQFYLFYLFTLWVSQKLSIKTNIESYPIHLSLIILVGVYSVLLDNDILNPLPIPGLFFSYWHYFIMGVLVSNVVRDTPNSLYILFIWILFEMFFQVNIAFKAYIITGIVSSLFIFVLWKRDLLCTALTRREFQYLGKISYTLYLIHPEVGWKVISVGKQLLNEYMSPVLAGCLFVVGIIVSIISAHILHLLFEKPSLKLCSKLKKMSFKQALRDTFRYRKQ
ncbi:MAG: acyltransferase [Gammaproteobacteria bacterium]|nr:acyltransferase [Gammaproteobacteria bacterium]